MWEPLKQLSEVAAMKDHPKPSYPLPCSHSVSPPPSGSQSHLQTGVGCWHPTEPAGRLLLHVITPLLLAGSYRPEVQRGSVLFGGG